MTKPHRKIFQINKPIRNLCANALLVFALVFLLVSICLLPEYAYAAQAVDAFEEVHKKLNGWVSGSFGKLITFISLVLSGVLGAMGFPARHVLGAIGVGLILASANSLVGFLFAQMDGVMEDRIPKTLDNPWRALGIPIDSWVIFIAVWSLFVLFDKGLYGIFAGILAASVFTRFRKRSIIRKAMRFMYWYFPSEMNTIPGVQGHIRKLQLTLDGTSKLK